MFGKLFGRSKIAPDPEPGPQLCMPTLASLDGLNIDSVVDAWKNLFPSTPILAAGDDKGVLSLETDDASLQLLPLPGPVPAPEIEGACEASWMWPEAFQEMKRHNAHVIVMCVGKAAKKDSVAEALATTRAAAAICRAGDAVGVYWGNGGQVHKPEFLTGFISDYEPDGMLPVPFWVGLRISGESARGPFTLSTLGMNPFGHKELEIIDTTMGLGDLRGTAYDLIGYLLSSGPILKHGQTFGPTQNDRWKVEHTTSRFRDGDAVIRLYIP